MSGERELLEKAKSKLQYFATYYTSDINDLIGEIEAALAEPEQEPVYLSEAEIYFMHRHSGINLPTSKEILSIARKVEQAVLKANGVIK